MKIITDWAPVDTQERLWWGGGVCDGTSCTAPIWKVVYSAAVLLAPPESA